MSIFANSLTIETVLIKQAEKALLVRDFDLFQKIVNPVWEDISQTPDFSGISNCAELSHLAGEFLVHYGKAHNLPHFQSRAKDLLTTAIDLFAAEDKPERVLSSQILLAFAYFQEGAREEYEAFLLDAEARYTGSKADSSYIRLQTNLIIAALERGQPAEAQQRITDTLPQLRKNRDLKIKYQFYLEAGITHRRLNRLDDAENFYKRGLNASMQGNNRHYQMHFFNNLSFIYRLKKRFNKSIESINHALALADGQDGWTANLLDSKALIYFDKKDYETAEEFINHSIKLFQRGEDFGGLCEALFNRAKIYFALDLREFAYADFAECYQTALERTGRTAAENYLKQFLELTAVVKGDDLFQQTDYFQRQRIESALHLSNGKITRAAQLLGIDHRTLSAMMKRKFPELYDLFEINRKSRQNK